MGKENISMSVIRRLPRYYRYLCELENSGILRVSSKELSSRMGFTASQIRQDFNCFGGFGQQGYGYNIEQLYNEIGNILGINNSSKAILIGAGNLGHAIATHLNFQNKGFELISIFDNNPEVVGTTVGGLVVLSSDDLEDFCKKEKPDIAILCIPAEYAAENADKLVSLGIKGFWNFTQYDLVHRYENIAVENVHLGDSLMTLCYQINEIDKGVEG